MGRPRSLHRQRDAPTAFPPGRPMTQVLTMGLGVGIRPDQIEELFTSGSPTVECVDFVEPYQNDFTAPSELYRVLPSGMPIVLHGSGISPAGADGIPTNLLAHARRLMRATGAPWIVEDLGAWRLDGEPPLYNPFWPVAFDEPTLELLCRRIVSLDQYFGRPFVCEFPPLDVVFGTLSATEFFSRLTARTGAWLALDVSHWLRYAQ